MENMATLVADPLVAANFYVSKRIETVVKKRYGYISLSCSNCNIAKLLHFSNVSLLSEGAVHGIMRKDCHLEILKKNLKKSARNLKLGHNSTAVILSIHVVTV